ncbi:MAG: hypothetical protein ACLTTH_16520 [Holdemanella porci]
MVKRYKDLGGDMFELGLAADCSQAWGLKVGPHWGVCPTPAISYLVRTKGNL